MNSFQPRGIETIELPVEALNDAGLLDAYRIWRLLSGGRKAPQIDDFNLDTFPASLAPLTTVVDVINGGRDFRYTYWGNELTHLFGRDETGRILGEHEIKESKTLRNSQFSAVVERKQPLVFQTVFEKAEDILATKTNLRLPFVDANDDVARILTSCTMLVGNTADQEALRDFWKG